MPGININKFFGEVPRSNERSRPLFTAEIALDVNLDAGSLLPWRERLTVDTKPFEVLSFARFGCCWIAFDRCADFALVQPNCDLVVRTGVRDYPEIATFQQACEDDWCRLGIPCPTQAPSAAVLAQAPIDRATTLRSYRIAYKNRYGWIGGGSPPSIAINVADGQPVTVQIPLCDFGPEFCVTSVVLYRSATAFESGSETSNPQNTDWVFVAELPCGTQLFVDDIRDLDLAAGTGEVSIFVQDETLPPPDDLHSVVSLENGSLAGISGKFIVQSEPFNPHSWPLKFYKRLWQGDDPVRLAAIKNVLYVATTGFPYTIITQPDSQSDGRQDVYRHREPLPIANPRSMAAGSNAVYYASLDGLVAMSGNQVRVVGEQLWTKAQWQQLHPNLMIGAIFDGHYFGFSDVYGFRLKTTEPEHFDSTNAALTRLSDRPQALWVSPNDALYMAVGNQIEQWNGGATLRPYTWQSTRKDWARRTPLSAGYCMLGLPGDVTATLVSERGDEQIKITSEDVFRVSSWFQVQQLSVRLTGTGEVTEFVVGTSYKEAFRAGAEV